MRAEKEQTQRIKNACKPVSTLVDHFRDYGLIVTGQEEPGVSQKEVHIEMSAGKITDDIIPDHIKGISQSKPGIYTCSCHSSTIRIIETTPVCFW